MQSAPSLQKVKKMKSNTKNKAKAFLQQFDLSEVTLDSLQSIIRKQGYTIVEFNSISNSENVATILSSLDLHSMAASSKGFTYADAYRRLVFIHDGLSDDEKLLVLAHEEGHIFCDHLASAPVLGRDVVEEHEASEFAHYILRQNGRQRIGCFLKQHKKAILVATAAIVLIIAICFAGCEIHRNNTYYGEYYITSTGNKYHAKNCGYIKGKKNAKRLTIDQYESGEYEPCKKCIGGQE